MHFLYTGMVQALREAAAFANELSADENFWRRIREHDRFDYTNLSPAEVEQRLRAATTLLKIEVWSPSGALQRIKYRKTVAFVDPRTPHTLYFHDKFISNGADEYVHTLVHEYVHDVDHHSDGNPLIEMGHGSNSSVGKGNSAPYWIGNLASDMFRAATRQPVPSLTAAGSQLSHEEGSVSDGAVVAGSTTPLQSFDQEKVRQ